IINLLGGKAAQSFCNEKKMVIVMLGQLLNRSYSELLTWCQLRRCKLSKATGRKPIWFEKIEQIILEGPSSRKVKPEWQQDMINTLTPRAELLKISIDKRKKEWQTENDESTHTTRLIKCKGWQINEGSDISGLQCTLWRQLRSKKLALQNNWVKKAKESGEFLLEIPLESLVEKRNKVQISGDKPV
ncbi:5439_t:CDS:2, partial [Gigaspora rosea]